MIYVAAGLVVAALVAMAAGRVDPLVALLVALILAGILGIAPADQLAPGLGNAGVITVAAMLVIARRVYELGGLSGTSGGAVCALLAWYGLADGDPGRPCELLDGFWADNSASAPHEQLLNPSMFDQRRRDADGERQPPKHLARGAGRRQQCPSGPRHDSGLHDALVATRRRSPDASN
jgi:hypothetical protein